MYYAVKQLRPKQRHTEYDEQYTTTYIIIKTDLSKVKTGNLLDPGTYICHAVHVLMSGRKHRGHCQTTDWVPTLQRLLHLEVAKHPCLPHLFNEDLCHAPRTLEGLASPSVRARTPKN